MSFATNGRDIACHSAPAGQKGPEKEPEKEAEKQSQKESQKEPQKEPQQEREVTRTPEGVWKHGRFYGDWKPDRYLSPIDRVRTAPTLLLETYV